VGDGVTELREPYVCLLWQLLNFPLAEFGSLWGGILMKGKTNPEQSKESLEAMEHLPAFLGKFRSRNSLAAKLEDITGRLVQHVKSIYYSQGECP